MTLDQKLKAHGERLAREHFKKVNPHLSEDEYYLRVENSMTMLAYLQGYTAAAEVFRLAGRIEGIESAALEFDYIYEGCGGKKPDILQRDVNGLRRGKEKLEAQLAALLGDK